MKWTKRKPRLPRGVSQAEYWRRWPGTRGTVVTVYRGRGGLRCCGWLVKDMNDYEWSDEPVPYPEESSKKA